MKVQVGRVYRRLLKRSRHFGIPVENEAERVSAVTPAAADDGGPWSLREGSRYGSSTEISFVDKYAAVRPSTSN